MFWWVISHPMLQNHNLGVMKLMNTIQSRKEGSRFQTLMAAQLLLEKSSASDTKPREKDMERHDVQQDEGKESPKEGN
jgi:hypothetical protein